MEHYDLRVIEDCLVFSYEVEYPNYPEEKTTKQKKNMRFQSSMSLAFCFLL